MSKPSRPSDPSNATGVPRTFFISASTAGGRNLLQSERMASLLIDVFRYNMRLGRFTVHDFVVMPNHVHILMTIPGTLTIEKAVQFIKGGFSFRAGKELGFRGEVWHRGFSDVRITTEQSFRDHQAYIDQNPVKAGLTQSPNEYPFASSYLKTHKQATGKRAREELVGNSTKCHGTTLVVPEIDL
jgi:putative transposase